MLPDLHGGRQIVEVLILVPEQTTTSSTGSDLWATLYGHATHYSRLGNGLGAVLVTDTALKCMLF